jgi:hypothetical protein
MHHHINELPPEILGEIFVRCLPRKAWIPHCPSVLEAPMLLCQVCSRWRELTLSLPTLWSSFSANLAHPIRAGRVSLAQLWIERSHNQPLFLFLDLRRSDPLTSHIMGSFLANIHRWNNVAFAVDDDSARGLLAIPGGSARLLESFGVHAPKCSTEIINEISPILLSFQNLRRLHWYSRSTPTTLLNMSFSKLTHIKLECPLPFNECVRFISRCSQICDLELERIVPSPAPQNLPVVTFPYLFSLSVGICDSDVLDYFTLPSLKSLYFPRIKLENFEKFIARSSCKLESFHLGDFRSITEEEVISYLRMPCLQSLRELHISADRLTDRTLAILQYYDSETSILPHLELLSVANCDTTDGVVSDIIASRWFPTRVCRDRFFPASLKWVDVSFRGRKQRIVDRLKLQDFSAHGLAIRTLFL